MVKRKIYLAMKSLQEAQEIFLQKVGPYPCTGIEEVLVENSLGRVTAEPVFARYSSPPYHSAAMDGVAVKAEKTYGATERRPIILELGTEAVWINTGQPLPKGFDSVIMVEKIHQLDANRIEIRSAAYPWQHVRKVGEDIVATELLLPQNHQIRPVDMGAMVGAGIFSVKVRQRPKVVIIPSGDELVSLDELREADLVEEGQVVEYNSLVLSGLVKECGAQPLVWEKVPDNREAITEALKKAVASASDLIIINAGSSAGSKDYTAEAIQELGELLVHGVTMMPGKPTILGLIKGKPVVGNPGYPVSAVLSFEQFVAPILYYMVGVKRPEKRKIRVKPTRDIPSKLGVEEFVRVNIGLVGDRYVATPLPRAAGAITTLIRAEGILRIDPFSEGIAQNQEVEAELLVDEEELLNTLVFIGSHDITIDIFSDELRKRGLPIRVSSANVGSLGGLMALRKGICHLAGSHLLDTETGQYNLSYIKRYLKGVAVSVYHLVKREQGLIVAKGNPKGIKGIQDLLRDDVTFVNRQGGSGTRVLLDHLLQKSGIEPYAIRGYDHEEFTHMAVAVDVLSGAADCGMGIFAAAKALDLDFIPLEKEQYDLIIPKAYAEHPHILALLETIASTNFKERVRALGGYDPSKSGVFWTTIE